MTSILALIFIIMANAVAIFSVAWLFGALCRILGIRGAPAVQPANPTRDLYLERRLQKEAYVEAIRQTDREGLFRKR